MSVECGGREAKSNLLRAAFTEPEDRDNDGLFDTKGGQGRRAIVVTDPSQDTFDRYGRLLAYVTTRVGAELGSRQLAAGWPRSTCSSDVSVATSSTPGRRGVLAGTGGAFTGRRW